MGVLVMDAVLVAFSDTSGTLMMVTPPLVMRNCKPDTGIANAQLSTRPIETNKLEHEIHK